MIDIVVKDKMEVLREYSTNHIVWRVADRVFKREPKYMSDNSYYFLKLMETSNYSPKNIQREDIETISMDYIEPHLVKDENVFMSHYKRVLAALKSREIRHGDLTEYSIIVHNDKPYIIDFSESRWMSDPIISKRPQPDSVILLEAMEKLCMKL